MICRNCKFYQSGYLWNRCALTGDEYFREFSETSCQVVDDAYIFLEGCKPFGFVKGESALKYMESEGEE